MLSLQEFIDGICYDTKLKICIHDISGLLLNEKLNIRRQNKIHFCEFCNTAKSTQKGYKLCISCKSLANKKAISSKMPFSGYCPWGIFEAAYPVVINGSVRCIVYAGNSVTDDAIHSARSDRASRITGVDKNALAHAAKSCENNVSSEKITRIAQMTADFIVLLSSLYMYDKLPVPAATKSVAFCAKEYVDLNFRHPITLLALSKIYFINEKYLGRIFKKMWKKSFHEYLNDVRLNNASSLLKFSNMTIIEIAFDSGFENVTYFNRLFRRKFGKTPTQYRAENSLQR